MVLIVLTGFMTSYAQAGLVPTQSVIDTEQAHYTQQQLQTALDSQELRDQLVELGVDPAQLGDRIASLTPNEIKQLNAEIQQQPAGGIIGVLVLLFVVFIVTDMLCATDIFGFVNCINK